MDWEGPVPLIDDEGTITVEELTEMLTDPRKDALQEPLTALDSVFHSLTCYGSTLLPSHMYMIAIISCHLFCVLPHILNVLQNL